MLSGKYLDQLSMRCPRLALQCSLRGRVVSLLSDGPDFTGSKRIGSARGTAAELSKNTRHRTQVFVIPKEIPSACGRFDSRRLHYLSSFIDQRSLTTLRPGMGEDPSRHP